MTAAPQTREQPTQEQSNGGGPRVGRRGALILAGLATVGGVAGLGAWRTRGATAPSESQPTPSPSDNNAGRGGSRVEETPIEEAPNERLLNLGPIQEQISDNPEIEGAILKAMNLPDLRRATSFESSNDLNGDGTPDSWSMSFEAPSGNAGQRLVIEIEPRHVTINGETVDMLELRRELLPEAETVGQSVLYSRHVGATMTTTDESITSIFLTDLAPDTRQPPVVDFVTVPHTEADRKRIFALTQTLTGATLNP